MANQEELEPDWYAVLGVSPSASPEEIKSAYRRCARDYHPDYLHGVSPALRAIGEEKLKEINAAYDVLSDPARRQAYDERRAAQERQAQEDDTHDRLHYINRLWDKGRINEAAAAAAELWKLRPQHVQVRNVYAALLLEMALARARAGRRDEAAQLLMRALDIAEDPALKARIQQSLGLSSAPDAPRRDERRQNPPDSEDAVTDDSEFAPTGTPGITHLTRRQKRLAATALVILLVGGVTMARRSGGGYFFDRSTSPNTQMTDRARTIETVVPPPPAPGPARPNYTRLMTSSLGSDLVLSHTTFWHSFRSLSSSFWSGSKEAPRIVFTGQPLRIRASGQFQQYGIVTRPDGVQFSSVAAKFLGNTSQDTVAPSLLFFERAPFRALLGRICAVVSHIEEEKSRGNPDLARSNLTCGEPFTIGSDLSLCPGRFPEGELQFAVNDGFPRRGYRPFGFSGLTGAYYLEVETVEPARCEPGKAAGSQSTTTPSTVAVVADSVSSRQKTWRAVHASLDRPIRLRASGEMQPLERSPIISGPDGFDYRRIASRVHDVRGAWLAPDGSFWIFPDRLAVPHAPYQALIGRFCRSSGCSKPFVVGSQHVLCPQPLGTTLELWTNLQYKPNEWPRNPLPAIDENELPSRRGEYRFELTYGSSAECKAGT